MRRELMKDIREWIQAIGWFFVTTFAVFVVVFLTINPRFHTSKEDAVVGFSGGLAFILGCLWVVGRIAEVSLQAYSGGKKRWDKWGKRKKK
jgi:hypothetical protein